MAFCKWSSSNVQPASTAVWRSPSRRSVDTSMPKCNRSREKLTEHPKKKLIVQKRAIVFGETWQVGPGRWHGSVSFAKSLVIRPDIVPMRFTKKGRGASRSMTPEVFATDSLRPRDQQEAWREWFQPMLEVTPRCQREGSFRARNAVWRLDGIVVSQVNAPAVSIKRTPTHIRRDPIDHWGLGYCHQGGLTMATERRSLQAQSGAPFFWSLGQAYEAERNDVALLQFYLSRDVFQDIGHLLDAACGIIVDTPLGALLTDFMLSLERRLPDLAITEVPRVTSALRALIAACIAPSADRMAVARNQLDWGRRERVRKAVRTCLCSPRLTPEALARAVGMSRSNLYRLLEADGGVAQYIRRQRLLAAYDMLTDPKVARPVSVIADVLCFAEPSGFSRAFRTMFGHSPTEIRAAATAGVVLPRPPDKISAAAEPRFSSFLQGL
jgi:AraC-like DNA-binding protein